MLASQIQALLVESERIHQADGAAGVALAQQALALAEQIDDHERSPLYLESLIMLATATFAAGDSARAMGLILQAQELLSYHQSDAYALKVYNTLAVTHIYFGDYAEALTTLHTAQQQARAANDRKAEAEVLGNIGLTYGWMQSTDKALDAFQQALELAGDDQANYALLLNNYAYATFQRGDVPTALKYAQDSLEITRQTHDLTNQVVVLGTLSEIYTALGELRTAEACLDEGLRVAEATGVRKLRTEILRARAVLYITQGQIDPAISTYHECLMLAGEFGAKPVIEECQRELARLYEQQGDYARALDHLKAYGAIVQAISNERVQQRISVLEQIHQHERLRQEHDALQGQNTLLEQLVHERSQALTTQQHLLDTIAAFSTPMLPLLPGVLLVPIIGTLDSRRELQMHEQLLNSITQARAQVVLLDITGVPIVDIQVASALLEMLREVRLLGCQMIMVGIRPEIAQALVSLGIDLTELTTRAALEDGLTAALGMIGRAIVTRR